MKRKLRYGDLVEWSEASIKHTGVILERPKDVKTGFFAVKDDTDGSVHILAKSRLSSTVLKVDFT